MNVLLMVPFLLELVVSPVGARRTIVIDAIPLVKECASGVPEWNTTRGQLQVVDPYRVVLRANEGPGVYEVWANIPGTVCGGFIDLEVP